MPTPCGYRFSRPHCGRTALLGALAVGLGLCTAGRGADKALQDILIDDTNVYPESMSAATDGTLFIGSIKGIVFRAEPGSPKAEPWIKPTPQNGMLSIFGVVTDEPAGTLWLCSSPNTLRDPPATGTASLMAFDLKTGSQKGVYPFPAPASICNDITIARDGTAYVSDTPNGRILKLAPGAKALELFASDTRLRGIDGLVLSDDGVLYVNIVTRGLLLRVDRKPDGSVGEITQLSTDQSLGAPDGFRLLRSRTFLLAEGSAGRIDEVTIDGDHASIKILRDGLTSPPAVTAVGNTAYALEGKIGYLFDPRLRGEDPGAFKVYAVPMGRPQPDTREIAALKSTIATLAAQADRLDDINKVKKLQRAYGYYLDRGYWQEAADLFADDATLEVGVDGVYVGKARILQRLVREGGGSPGPGLPFGQINHHMQLQPVVHVAADGMTAKGRWRELALLGQFKQYAAWGDGIYENEYVKQGGVWKIGKAHFYPNFVAPYRGGWAGLQPVTGDWSSAVAKELPADRPPTVTYKPFPDLNTPAFHYDTAIAARAFQWSAPVLTRGGASPDIAKLKEVVASYEHDLAILGSRDELENLQAAYGYYTDKGLWKQAATLFAANGTFEFGQRGVYVSRGHILKAVTELFGPEGLRPGQLNNYMMLQPIIDVAADNRSAKARWRSDVQVGTDGQGQWGEGVYENEYVNEGGTWKISKLHFYVTAMADYNKGWTEGPIPLDGPSKSVPPDRPPTEVYQALPEIYLPPYHYKNPVAGGTPDVTVMPESASPDAASGFVEATAAARSLARRIESLKDHAAIEKLQRAYGYYVDKAQWPDVADLYQENATMEIGGRGIFLGKKRVLEYLVTGLGPVGGGKGQLFNHQQFQGIVDVAPDGQTAKGRWTAFVMASVGWGDCTYENEYVKEGGIWKIKKLHAPFNMYTSYKEGWQVAATPNTRPDSFLPPPDLPPSVTYLTYPSFYIEPYHYPNPVTGRPMPAPNPAAGGVAPMKNYASR